MLKGAQQIEFKLNFNEDVIEMLVLLCFVKNKNK